MPIINRTLGFRIERDYETFTVTKIKTDDELKSYRKIEVEVTYRENSRTFTKITKKLLVEDLLVFKIPFKDGIYKIKVISTDEVTEEVEYKEFLLKSYKQLLASIIEDTEDYLCGCPCKNCSECEEESGKINLLLKMLSFYTLNREYYKFFLNTGLNCVEDSILKDVQCIINNQYIKGKNTDTTLHDKMIGTFFYIFYIGEKSIYSCCPEQIDNIFRIDNVSSCLLEKNIDVSCIEYSILSDVDYNITDNNLIEL